MRNDGGRDGNIVIASCSDNMHSAHMPLFTSPYSRAMFVLYSPIRPAVPL